MLMVTGVLATTTGDWACPTQSPYTTPVEACPAKEPASGTGKHGRQRVSTARLTMQTRRGCLRSRSWGPRLGGCVVGGDWAVVFPRPVRGRMCGVPV
jgi:hypothetical protein